MTKILILYSNAGHGHRKVAETIAKELKRTAPQDASIEIFDSLDKSNALFRHFYPRSYFALVRWAPWLWGFFFYLTDLPFVYALIQPLRSFWNTLQSRSLRSYLKQKNYDFIVFTHFFPAEVCATLKKKRRLKSTLITVVTDVIPHRVWQNPGTDFYWVMAEESKTILLANGIREDSIRIGGIPVDRVFQTSFDRANLKKKFNLDPDRFTILFSSGSFGLGKTEAILNSLDQVEKPVQAIVVCGNNKKLFETLKCKTHSFPIYSFEFIDFMHELMAVSDVLIAKAGGSTTSESLAMNLPMVITDSIPGQEMGNTNWLISRRVAFKLRKPAEAHDLVNRFISEPDLIKHVKGQISEVARPEAAKSLAEFILNHA
ncbi:MAG: hypothetical protein A3J52_00170 [Omnitrophica bacterium RIFCSPHIGHO2_02_FULL_49_9]|nr:MAG: hypothetical protein A3J52_00170 [Omnitrophica bacterium RIFCSPHIGHO2_02_FULL_49_9]